MTLKVCHMKIQRGPLTKITFSINSSEGTGEIDTDCFYINGLAVVSFKFDVATKTDAQQSKTKTLSAFISLTTYAGLDKYIVKLNLSCKALQCFEEWVCPYVTSEWIPLTPGAVLKHKKQVYYLEITLVASRTMPLTFADLYTDTVLTDFCLYSEDGKVFVHKVCLAIFSNVFKTLLEGKWQKTSEGSIEGASLQTLCDLKDYMYLGILPDEGLCALLLIAKHYQIDNLKEEILMKIAQTITAENLYSHLEFTHENHIPELTIMIFQLTPDDIVHEAYENKNKLKR